MIESMKDFGTEGVLALVIYLLVKDLAAPKWKAFQAKRNGNPGNPGNPNGKPGKTKTCIDNMKTLSRIEESIANIKNEINKIWLKIDTKKDKE